MRVDLYNQSGETVGKVDLPDEVFKLEPNINLIQQAAIAQSANSRQRLAHAKGRAEVRGGGAKPWRQKGTGRARHGSRRSPIWVGGGVTFGPTVEKNFMKKINKKTKQKALFMALSSKAKDSHLIVLDKLILELPKTKEAKAITDNLTVNIKDYKKTKTKRDSLLLMMPEQNPETKRAFSNLSYVETIGAKNLNIKDILRYKYLIILKDAVKIIEKHYNVTKSEARNPKSETNSK